MKASWLVPLMLCAFACGANVDDPRGQGRQGGSAGATLGASGSFGVSGGSTAGIGGSLVTSMGGSAGMTATAGSAGSSGGGAGGGGPIVHPNLRTVVYLPNWRGALMTWLPRIDFSRMTYLNLCFADVDAAGNVTFSDQGLDTFVASVHAAGVKVCMAIGGATVISNGGVYATVLQDTTRETFVSKLGQFASDHQLDCIDVDLEGNGVNQYHEAFVSSLAAKLHAENKEMTAAVGSWFGNKITDKAIQAFDFINVMAYDLHDPNGSTTPVQSSSLEESTKEVDYWVNRGLAKSKAVYGVPFYGYRWMGGAGKSDALTYAQLLAMNPMAATQDQLMLDGATVYLNSRATIAAKTAVARTYGGVMAWELGQDAAGDASLLKAIIDAQASK
jgi:GH18 family chitinase